MSTGIKPYSLKYEQEITIFYLSHATYNYRENITLGYEMKHSWLIDNNYNVLFILFHIIFTHHDYRLNQLQLKFLEELRMIEIMKALQTFVIWLQEGMYDFSSLPLTLKEDLCDCHIQELKQATEVAVSEGNDIITNDAVSLSICIDILYIYYNFTSLLLSISHENLLQFSINPRIGQEKGSIYFGVGVLGKPQNFR